MTFRWPWQPKEATDQQYFQRTIKMDGKTLYCGCTFVKCTILFNGEAKYLQLLSCTFDNCQYIFAGPAAMTVAFLRLMVSSGDEGVVTTVAGLVGLKRLELDE